MSIGTSYFARDSRASSSRSPEADDDEIMWNASSPTNSDSSDSTNDNEEHHDRMHSAPQSTTTSRASSSTNLHAPPSSPPNKLASITKPSHPYRPSTNTSRPVRPRGLGLTPLSTSTSMNENALPLGEGKLPKAQPLARALFARKLSGSDMPHAGMGFSGKKKGGQKLIVPTKGFKTTFELDLTANELARK